MATMCLTHRWGAAAFNVFFLILAGSSLTTLDATNHEPRKLQVAIPIFENMTMLDVVGPYEILNTLPFVEVVFVSFKKGPISDLGTMTMEAKATFDEVSKPDVVVVPGGLGYRRQKDNKVLLNWIRKVHKTSMYTTSVCTGGIIMGAAGILRGIDATTHWSVLPLLANYGANPVSIRVVVRGKIITSAGVSSGIDMALTLAALLSDDLHAQASQLFNEYDPQPPFNTGTGSKATPELLAIVKEWNDDLVAKMDGTT